MGGYKGPTVNLLGKVMSAPIRIGILEDDPVMRDYLMHELDASHGFDVRFSAETLGEALVAITTEKTDLCVVDLQLPDGNGTELVKALRDSAPETKTLILTVLGDKASVLIAFEAGANGYLLKDTPPAQLRRDIKAVITGGNPISPQAATHLLQLLSQNQKPNQKPNNVLTERERQVLSMFSRGLSYKETAAAMEISTSTVSAHVKSIYRKLSVHSRNEAIFEAVQNGWLDF